MSSMAPSHEHIEELIAAHALNGLEEPERFELEAEMESHGPECPECARLLSEYSETAARLAFALDPVPPSAGEEDSPPPIGSTAITKYLSVSKILPDPIAQSKTWRSPMAPGISRIALSRAGDSVPCVS